MGRLEEIPRERMSGPLRRSAVKKNVAAIHVSGKLTLLQRKLSNVLLLNAYDDLLAKPLAPDRRTDALPDDRLQLERHGDAEGGAAEPRRDRS